MKKLYLLVTGQFFRSFLPTFFVVLFIMLMQFIWLYIDDLAGKGISWFYIAQLMFYFSASIVQLALPLSILLASIMSFGNLGETYELIAAKAAGVSIWRIFKPMFLIMLGMSLFAFFVSNVLIPKANLKYKALLYDIKQQKPALLIQEGVFYTGIEGISMRIGKKNAQTNELQDILIYDNRSGSGKPVIVVAQRGEMHMSENGRYLFFTLFNGARYEEMEKQANYEKTSPHSKLTFAEEQIVFDMFSFSLNRSDEQMFKDGYQMLNIIELRDKIDSSYIEGKRKLMSVQAYYDMFLRINDVLYAKYRPHPADSLSRKDMLSQYKGDKLAVIQAALNNTRTIKSVQDFVITEMEGNNKSVVRHTMEWHRKFTLSIACIIMFFIGAPFGAIIRKGGFGMPVVISVLLYIVFHILSITGDKMAKTGTASPFTGIWLAVMVLTPVSVFLTYQAANDSGIFDKSAWVNLYRRFFRKFKKA